MPRTCTVCKHPERASIDAAIVAGASYRDVAGQFHTSKTTVARHASEHIPATLVQAQQAREVAEADDLLSLVRNLQAEALDILAQAKAQGDLRTALAAIHQARENVQLFARLKAFDAMPQTIVEVAYPSSWLNAFAGNTTIDAVDAGQPPDARTDARTARTDAPTVTAIGETLEEHIERRNKTIREQQRQEEQRQQEERDKRIADFIKAPTDELWSAEEIA